MADYIIKNDEELALLIETRQKLIRTNLAKEYMRCRKALNLTQADVAELLGVTRPNITRFENGTYNPTLDMLVRVAECMGKDLEIKLVDREEKGE